MRANPNTADVNLDWNEQARAIRLVVDQDRARVLGLTPQDIAESLQALLTGVTITQVRDGIELVNVVARAVPEERLRPEALADLTISIRNGKIIPLSQVARLEYVYEEPILWRQSRDLTITVRAEVNKGVQAPDVTMVSLQIYQPRYLYVYNNPHIMTDIMPDREPKNAFRPGLVLIREQRNTPI